LIAWKQKIVPAMVIALLGIFIGVMYALLPVLETVQYAVRAPLIVRMSASTLTAMAILTMAMLSFQRLRGRLDLCRVVGMAMYGLLFALHLMSYPVPQFFINVWVEAARGILGIACFLLMLFVSWCLAFRQVQTPNRPPVDSARNVHLTCPRCQLQQEIPSGHGQCAGCRLQIAISLDESV
jgi:hypothetical protein